MGNHMLVFHSFAVCVYPMLNLHCLLLSILTTLRKISEVFPELAVVPCKYTGSYAATASDGNVGYALKNGEFMGIVTVDTVVS